MNKVEDWISTGDAARMLGYSPEHFRNKFDGMIPCRRYKVNGKLGHRKWLRAAVLKLRDDDAPPLAI